VLVFTDSVLEQIGTDIGAPEPERGGALFGIRDSNVICHLACDTRAVRSRVHYLPSRYLQDEVHAIERQTNLVFKGIIHSHPGLLSEPSGQDLTAFSKSLADNLHIASFVAPIVTRENHRPMDWHEINLSPDARMSIYVAYRSDRETWRGLTRDTRIEQSKVSTMPIEEHLSALCATVGIAASNLGRGYFSIGHVTYISRTIQVAKMELNLLFPPIYPMCPPLVMVSEPGRDPLFVDLSFGAELNTSFERPNWISRLAAMVETSGETAWEEKSTSTNFAS
jgi:hypothetical protein